MGQVFYKITWTDNLSVSHDITDATIINQDDGVDITSSTFSFSMDNTNGEYSYPNTEFHQGDTVDIYLDRIDASTKIFTGYVDEIRMNIEDRGPIIEIHGVSRTLKLLNYLDSHDYSPGGSDQTSSQIIDDIITRTSSYTGVTVHSTDFVATTKNLTESFTYNQENIFDKLNELSQDEYTGAGRFIFYVDDDNKLHFKPKPGAINATVKEGIDIVNYNVTKTVFNVVNWVAIDAGMDKNDASILTYTYDVESILDNGWFMKFEKAQQLAGDLRKKWNDEGIYAGATNSEFIGSVRDIARKWGQNYLRTRGGWRWKGEFNMSGNDVYHTGDFLTFECPKVGWKGANKQNLRITDIKHSLDMSGWWTTINAEEDEET